MKTSELVGPALNWAVAKCEGYNPFVVDKNAAYYSPDHGSLVYALFSTNWSQGGPIIERENITLIRANSQYIEGKCVPLWFAETDKWVGHNITTGYEGEYFDPCFMIDEAGGCYGPTPLITAMRCYVASKLGDEVEIPKELLGEQ